MIIYSKDQNSFLPNRKNGRAALLIGFAFSLGFVLGGYVVGRYALIREMQLQADVLLRNGPALAACKIANCSSEIQEDLISANDNAMRQYVVLETTKNSSLDHFFYSSVWPIVFMIFSDQAGVSSNSLQTYYEKMGCGLNGVMCDS